MADFKATIDEVASLMEEFRLTEARLQSGNQMISFRRRSSTRTVKVEDGGDSDASPDFEEADEPVAAAPAGPVGTPVTSPMSGIYYGSASPGSSVFVKEGEPVSAGQIVGLIEAMKVFNEIPCMISGTVLQIVAQSGQIVNPGDVLLYVGV